MTDEEKREKVVRGLECCIVRDPDAKSNCVECPYNHEGIITNAPCANGLMADALALLKEQEEKIESLTEDIEVWKKRYKFMVLECKSSDDPNKEPVIVKYYTTEEVEQGKAVAFSND